MKRFLLFCFAVCTLQNIQSQNNYNDLVEVGDELVIAKKSGQRYQHIDVPRMNFIIKRGGIANMSSLENRTVTITEIGDGANPSITFKNADGRKFFRVYHTLTANLNRAIESGELKIKTEIQKDSLAK